MKINFDSSKKQNPAYDGGMKILYAPAKRAQSAWRWYIVVIITAAPLLFFLGKIVLSYIYVSAPGIVSLKKIELNSPETASIAKIYIQKGDKIKKGSKIADLTDPAIEDQLSALKSEMETLTMEKTKIPPMSLPVNPIDGRLEANIELAHNILDRQTAYLGKVRYLFTKGAATATELNLATSQYNQAQIEVSRAKADYSASRVVRPDTESKSRIERIERLKNEIESIERKKVRLEFKSQVSGIVYDVFVSENQSIVKGAPFAKLTVPGEYSIMAYINPSEIKYARKGKKVTIRMPGSSLLTGYITSDANAAKTIPMELLGQFSETRQAIEANITTSSPLPNEYQIDGLPIKVYFGFPGF